MMTTVCIFRVTSFLRGALLRARRTLRRPWLALVVALLALPAWGQPTCVPYGYGGAYAPGPPQWWVAAGTGFARFNTWVDDPRWLGATSINYGQGATKELQFRALFNPEAGSSRYLYLSWWFKAALETSSNPGGVNNQIYVALRAAGASTGLLLKITMSGGTSIATASASRRTIAVYPVNSDGSYGAQINPSPLWTDEVRVWVDDTTDQSTQIPPSTNTTESNNWAVHVRVPIGTNLGNGTTVGSNFNLWYELLQGTPSTPVISYTWPRPTASENFGVTTTNFVESVPATVKWPAFKLSEPATPPATRRTCAGLGVDIEPTDIKVTYPGSPAGSETEIKVGSVNTFSATPTNRYNTSPATAVPTEALHARFRIANWGIQPNTTDQADPSTGAWTTVGTLGDVQQCAPPGVQCSPTSIAQGSMWSIAGTWLPSASDFTNRSSHQCVMVELSSPTAVEFIRSSAFRNMRVAPASVFEQSAEVSVVGLPSAAAPARDVYLYTHTYNMPARVSGGEPGVRATGTAASRLPTDIPRDVEVERTRVRSAEEITLATEPVYIVRGYFDTGRRVVISGLERPVLQPMVAFGYQMDHKGKLYGWKHSLEGAQQIAPNFYLLAVQNNGKTSISTRIEAVETPISAYSIWLALGSTFPHGSFGNQHKSGLAANLGFEYIFTPALSVEATLGRHSFGGKNGGGDIDVTQFGANGKWYFAQPGFKPFLTAGVSGYAFDPGSTRFGVNLGAGVQVDLAPQWSLEGRYTLHQVTNNSPNSSYSTLTLGLRYAF